MPLIRRLPKRGFNPLWKTSDQVVNVESLNRFEKNSIVGPEEFKALGLVTSSKSPVKILGDGNLTKTLTVKAHAISGSAKKKIEAAGAIFEYLIKPEKRPVAPKKVQPKAKAQEPKKAEAQGKAERPAKAEKAETQKPEQPKQESGQKDTKDEQP
jgi:ribosomal protein L18E